jgi:small subunit ribosomal protein S3
MSRLCWRKDDMLKDYFIKQGIKETEIEKFIRTQFPFGDYSRTELQRTPLGIKIIIYTNKPGRIIGRGGKNINEITEMIKKRFGLENPQIDVKAVRNANLDAMIVAKQIASAIERGYNYKKIGNLAMRRVMDAGAIGVEIIISGRLTGAGGKSLTGKFIEGYLKHCGQPAKDLVDYGFDEANTKPGKVGIKVKIMKEFMDITGEIRKTVEPVIDDKTIEDVAEEAEPAAEEEEPKKRQKASKKEPGPGKAAGKKKAKKPAARKPAVKKSPGKGTSKIAAKKASPKKSRK